MSRDIFNKIGAASANNKGDVFRDGKGTLVITQCLYKNMNEGPTFVGRFKVLESASKGDKDPKSGAPVEPNPAGSRVGWPQKIEKHKSAAGNVKAFFLNVLGFNEAEVKPEEFGDTMAQACGPEQALRGMLVKYETYQQETKTGANAGRVNTYVKFVHVSPKEGNDEASIKKRRAELDATDPIV